MSSSCNFKHKSPDERLKIREGPGAASPGRVELPRLEKVRQENMKHFVQTYSKRPIGLHGAELPKFSDHLKEFWTGVKMLSSESSSNKITIVKPDLSSKKAFVIKKADKSETVEKPNQLEPPGSSPARDFFRNSRWTEYHHNFFKKSHETSERTVKQSVTPEVQRISRVIKTPKSFLASKAGKAKKASNSPCKSLLRSTGFNSLQN